MKKISLSYELVHNMKIKKLLLSLRSTDVRQSTLLNSYINDSSEDPRLFILRLKYSPSGMSGFSLRLARIMLDNKQRKKV